MSEPTIDDRKQQYIADARQWVRDYQQMMARAHELDDVWGLYQPPYLTNDDMPDDIMVNPDKIASFTDAFANIQSILATFDAGINVNFERVK